MDVLIPPRSLAALLLAVAPGCLALKTTGPQGDASVSDAPAAVDRPTPGDVPAADVPAGDVPTAPVDVSASDGGAFCVSDLSTGAGAEACATPCRYPEVCAGRACVAVPEASTGCEGPFDPTSDTVLPPGRHDFTTIHVRQGVTVRTSGAGWLDLRASAEILIEGDLDLSGAAGGVGAEGACTDANHGNGGGGATGNPLGAGATGRLDACAAVAGGGEGPAGGEPQLARSMPCAQGGGAGGGAGGGICHGGAGGGGHAGGGGGNGRLGGLFDAVGGVGGAQSSGAAAGLGGRGGGPPYDGESGVAPSCLTGGGGGGGGGSIGAEAAADLQVRTTFRPGSGGGGGGGHCPTCPTAPTMRPLSGGGGGGGGGGALRLLSARSITIGGHLRVNGGAGGAGRGAIGGGGGGGSGGVVVLSAPRVVVTGAGSDASVSATGGAGGASDEPACGAPGGRGGAGRIHVIVRRATAAPTCNLDPLRFDPPLPQRACVDATGQAGSVTLREWPGA